MIRWPTTILVTTAPVNLHMSFDRLAAIVREQLGADPKADTVVVFHNRRRTHVKLLWHDGSGYVLLYKRLDRGHYRIPTAIPATAKHVVVRREELVALLDGLDETLLRRARAMARAA
ncbi:MAG: IS66 family insertion sequence element accessory protein TnpB [Deltaproteobacteria bacterium]|nr:IS66 family insertion sequence element accessory protein TnpB [Deltaproteobacteria bacterium]